MSIPPLPAVMIEPLVRATLLEDLGRAGDITSDAIVPPDARADTALPWSRASPAWSPAWISPQPRSA
jgi:hypothetical protein